jgi:hypothetical protein
LRFRPNKLRVEILLPLFYNNGTEIEASKFDETADELGKQFTGCTSITPAQGVWFGKNSRKYIDVNSGFYVVIPYKEESIKYFDRYKKILKERFEQEEIFITYYPVKNLIL